MITWTRYKIGESMPRQDAWVGYINGRPQYAIRPQDKHLVLIWVAVDPKAEIACARGPLSIGSLQKVADIHRAEFTEVGMTPIELGKPN
jgi:hypothetical protein